MFRTSEKLSQPQGTTAFLAIIALALWQLRQTWRFLMLTGIGMIAATMLVCVGPLYSQVVLNASLRDFLKANPTHATILLQGRLQSLNAEQVQQVTNQFNQLALQDMGPVTSPTPQFFMQSSVLSIINGDPKQQASADMQSKEGQIVLNGYTAQAIPQHVTLNAGRLPQTAANGIEIAITPDMSRQLNLKVGDVMYVRTPVISFDSNEFWTIRVVGIFTPKVATDAFWRGTIFQVSKLSQFSPNFAMCLTSAEGLVDAYGKLDEPTNVRTPQLGWAYTLDPTRMDASNVEPVTSGMRTFLTDAANANAQMSVDQTTAPIEQLESYRSHMALAQVSVIVLLFLVVGMVLLFVSLMADLLIEQRTEAIALLRSRGASRRQVFSIFAVQSVGLGVVAFIVGPLIAVPMTQFLLRQILSAQDYVQVVTFIQDPATIMMNVWPFALLAVTVTLATVLLAIYRETGFDVLTLRREAARSTRRTVWQRFYLDVFLAILALACYGYSVYAVGATSLDVQASIQTLSPVVLLSSAFFLLACMLLFLRIFPVLVRWATHLAANRGSVGSMLALAQMARSPRHALRMTLLFALTTAFTIFALVFTTSQVQRTVDVATYQVGADFSAAISTVADTKQMSKVLKAQTSKYRAIKGVAAASMGYIEYAASDTFVTTVKAADADTFAQTAQWSKQYSSQSLPELMNKLKAERGRAKALRVIPALVGPTAWKTLRLTPGAVFPLTFTYTNPAGSLSNEPPSFSVVHLFQAVAQVDNIPTMNAITSDLSASEQSELDQIGILVDYQSFASVYPLNVALALADNKYIPQTLPLNYVWVRAQEKANLDTIRRTLGKQVLADPGLSDRQAFVSNLQHDPFYLNLLGMLVICMFTPLFLALLGSLLSSWLTAQGRLSSFALLRALGSAPRQLASVLSWEQGIVYTIMFTLGLAAGTLLSIMVLPALILTNVAVVGSKGSAASAASVFHNLPPIQVIIPPTLGAVLGVLFAICVLALAIMIYIVSRPSISQTLRLNVD